MAEKGGIVKGSFGASSYIIGKMSGNLAEGAGSHPSDAELVDRARAGERFAFDLLMQRHEREVITVAYRMLGQYEDALELSQEAFLRAYRGLPTFRQEASFRTWLYQITLNLSRHRRRWYARHRVGQTVPLDAPAGDDPEGDTLAQKIADRAAGPREEAARSELRGKIQAALGRLPDPFRSVVVLRDMEGMAYEEIAEICREPVGTVKSRLHRARAMLRAALGGASR